MSDSRREPRRRTITNHLRITNTYLAPRQIAIVLDGGGIASLEGACTRPPVMNLSREAIITLRGPTRTDHPPQAGNTAPLHSWLAGLWFVTHSTRSDRKSSQRNVRIALEQYQEGHGFSATLSHQTLDNSSIESTSKLLAATDLHDGKASVLGDTCEVLAWGKEGQLESWMIDDGSGWIADSSGERRSDWRNSYVVVYWRGDADEAAIEVWDRFASWRPLSSQTIGKIRAALLAVEDEPFRLLVKKLDTVKMDDGRDEHDRTNRERY